MPPSPNLTGVTEIISSAAIDADKIDYVNRDAQACGSPVGVDVSRIFLRSAFISISREKLLETKLKDNPASEEILFVVNASGVDTIDEITLARTALYQRVYLHPVTRTAEMILARTLKTNAESKARDNLLCDAIGLWSSSDDALLFALTKSEDKKVKQLALSLFNRKLPKKAFSFSSSLASMHMPIQRILPKIPHHIQKEIEIKVSCIK